jgi:hypothetical protein
MIVNCFNLWESKNTRRPWNERQHVDNLKRKLTNDYNRNKLFGCANWSDSAENWLPGFLVPFSDDDMLSSLLESLSFVWWECTVRTCPLCKAGAADLKGIQLVWSLIPLQLSRSRVTLHVNGVHVDWDSMSTKSMENDQNFYYPGEFKKHLKYYFFKSTYTQLTLTLTPLYSVARMSHSARDSVWARSNQPAGIKTSKLTNSDTFTGEL